MSTLQIVPRPDLARLAELSVAPLASPCSRMSYAGYLKRFLTWLGERDGPKKYLNRETVSLYLAHERGNGKSPSVIAQNMKAIRLLALEAQHRGLLTQTDLAGIVALKTPHAKGTRAGNWLQIEDVQELIRLPDRSTRDGLRDAVVIGMLVGCLLRRAEVSEMTWDRYQMREGRWCFIDLKGKGGKIRTVPVPEWVEVDIARLPEFHVKRGRNSQHKIIKASRVNIWYIVNRYIKQLSAILGHEHARTVAPHDLRRTGAKLMLKAGVPLEQICLTLGHSDLKTTALYLGLELELSKGKAGVDQVNLTNPVCA